MWTIRKDNVFILLAFVVQDHAQKLVAAHPGNMHDSLDKFADALIDNLFEQRLTMGRLPHEELDKTTLGKPLPDTSHSILHNRPLPSVPRPTFPVPRFPVRSSLAQPPRPAYLFHVLRSMPISDSHGEHRRQLVAKLMATLAITQLAGGAEAATGPDFTFDPVKNLDNLLSGTTTPEPDYKKKPIKPEIKLDRSNQLQEIKDVKEARKAKLEKARAKALAAAGTAV